MTDERDPIDHGDHVPDDTGACILCSADVVDEDSATVTGDAAIRGEGQIIVTGEASSEKGELFGP